MRNWILLIVMLATLSGCGMRNRIVNKQIIQKIDVNMVTDVTFEFALELERERFLRLEHSYAFYEDGITGFQFFFSTQDISEVKDARRLLVEIVEGLLDRINSSVELCTELQNGAATPMDLEIFIDYQSFFSLYVDPLMVGGVTLKNGIVRYLADDAKNPNKDKWHLRIERYGIAKRIIEIENGFHETVDVPPPPLYPYKDRYVPPLPPIRKNCLDCGPGLFAPLEEVDVIRERETIIEDHDNVIREPGAIIPRGPPRPVVRQGPFLNGPPPGATPRPPNQRLAGPPRSAGAGYGPQPDYSVPVTGAPPAPKH